MPFQLGHVAFFNKRFRIIRSRLFLPVILYEPREMTAFWIGLKVTTKPRLSFVSVTFVTPFNGVLLQIEEEIT